MNNTSIIKEATLGTEQNSLRWVHLLSDHSDSESTLIDLGLSSSVQEGLLAQDTRPKSIPLEGGTLVYLRALNLNANSEPEDMVSVRLWVTEKLIVTTTRLGRDLRSIEETFEEAKKPERIKDAGDFLCLLIDSITDKICAQIERCEDKLDSLENEMDLENDSIDRAEIIHLRRQSAQVKRFVMPQREALNSLLFTFNGFSKLQAFRLREEADRVTRYLETVDVIRERTLLIQDELRHKIVEKQSQRMYVLSLVTAVFLPLSFLTGLFGMNVAGLPGTENIHSFNILVGLMLVISVFITILMKFGRWV